MNRRDVFLCVIGVTTTTILSGCGYLGTGTISIAIMSRAERSHTLELAFSQNDEISYSETYELDPDDEIYEKDLINGGQYNITAIIDDDGRSDYRFEMNGCHEQILTIELDRVGDVDFDNKIC